MNLLQHAATIDKVKVGDWVFSLFGGWDRITRIADGDNLYPIATTRNAYDGYGKQNTGDKYPRIFLIDPFNGTKPPEPEIDWEKVPKGTGVEVFSEGWVKYPRDFVAYCDGLDKPFVVYVNGPSGETSGIEQWSCIRLIGEPKPEWLKAAV